MSDDERFEELPDVDDDLGALDDYGDLDATLAAIEPEESREEDLSFTALYTPIRTLFCSDPVTLDSFSACTTHLERVRFLSKLQEVQRMLDKLRPLRPTLPESDLPHPSSSSSASLGEWRKCPALSHGKNPRYPHLSKAVEVRVSKSEGRHLVAKQKLLPGEVILVDRPCSTSLFQDYYSSHCLNCCKRLGENAEDCPSCDKVRFCSSDCLSVGYRNVHRWECRVMEVVDSQDIGRMATLAYRLIAATGYEFICKNLESFNTQEPTYREGDYYSAYSQVDNSEVRPTGDHLKRGVTGIILARCLQLSNWFPEEVRESRTDERFLQVAALLVKHIQANACNAYEINEFVKKGASMINCRSIELGGAVYPTISLSNHSCCANTSRTNHGTDCVVRTTKTIFPNEKVYDNYGYFYHVEPQESRQRMLEAQYFFTCNCQACKESWPGYRDLSQRPTTFFCNSCKAGLGSVVDKVKKCPKCKKEIKGLGKVSNQIATLQRDFRKVMDGITEENAELHIKQYSNLLQEIEKVCKMPCKEIIECQQVLLQCYAMLGNSATVQPEPEECQLVLRPPGQDDFDDESSEEEEEGIPELI